MLFSDSHILSTILFTPLVGAILMLFIPSNRPDLHRWMGNLFGFLGLAVSLPLHLALRLRDEHLRASNSSPIVRGFPRLARTSRLGIDGLSYLLVMLTTVLGPLAILSSWSAIKKREKEYYILLLLLQTGMLGVFMSLDFVLFYVFWEVMLVPMYFLIGVWGSERRLYAAIKFFLYTLAGSVLMLLAILAIYYYRGTFDIREILIHPFTRAVRLAGEMAVLGILFRLRHQSPHVPVSHLVARRAHRSPHGRIGHPSRRLAENGHLRFLRFSVPMFPDATLKYRWIIIVLSLIGIVYGALVCMMQKDMKKLIAYSSVSHMGFCTLGIFALTPLGLSGSIIQQLNHGISTGAPF